MGDLQVLSTEEARPACSIISRQKTEQASKNNILVNINISDHQPVTHSLEPKIRNKILKKLNFTFEMAWVVQVLLEPWSEGTAYPSGGALSS